MKNLTQILEANSLNIQDGSIGYIDGKDLETFLKVAKKFLSEDALYVINWLIEHSTEYAKMLNTGKKGNPLQNFYNAGIPKDTKLKDLYKAIGKLKKNDRLLEIPCFLTKEQFDGIVSKKISPDEILLDLKSEKGRTECVKKYTPMVHKIAHSLMGKGANFTYDDLLQYGMLGLTWAMNDYGKHNADKTDLEESNYKAVTFLNYAYFRVYNAIVNSIAGESRTVRVPDSEQKRQKQEQGYINKNNTVSGDRVVSTSKDGTNAKTLFDFVGGSEAGGKEVEHGDKEFLWGQVKKRMIELADEKTWEILKLRFGLEGVEKMDNKEIAKKYNMGESLVTYYVKKALAMFFKDATIKKYGQELRDMMAESQNQKETEEDQMFEPHSLKVDENSSDE